MLKTAAETLTTIAADPRHLGARIGVIAVLHSWGQTLDHHPHVHCIVPAGGISLNGSRWIAFVLERHQAAVGDRDPAGRACFLSERTLPSSGGGSG